MICERMNMNKQKDGNLDQWWLETKISRRTLHNTITLNINPVVHTTTIFPFHFPPAFPPLPQSSTIKMYNRFNTHSRIVTTLRWRLWALVSTLRLSPFCSLSKFPHYQARSACAAVSRRPQPQKRSSARHAHRHPQ